MRSSTLSIIEQSLHFEQLFATVRLTGCTDVKLEHISFGTVLGEDGRPYKPRSGTAVGLSGLLDEAVERAFRIVCENDDARDDTHGGPLLSEEERKQVATAVGIGAIKYADLAHNSTSDYVFSYDKMLAHEWQHGRLHAIQLCACAQHFYQRGCRYRIATQLGCIDLAKRTCRARTRAGTASLQ